MEYIAGFLIWWYYTTLIYLLVLIKRVLIFTDNKVAFSVFARNLFTPLFGDPSLVGRVVALVYRFLRSILGGSLLLVVLISFINLPIIWILFPVILVISLKANGILLFAIIFILWSVISYLRPKKSINEKGSLEDPIKACTFSAKKMISSISKGKFEEVVRQDKRVGYLLTRVGLKSQINDFFEKLDLSSNDYSIESLLNLSFEIAKESKTNCIDTPHVFYGLLALSPKIDTLLYKFDSSLKSFRKALIWIEDIKSYNPNPPIWSKNYQISPIGGVNRDWTGRVTPTLNRYSHDLTESAGRGKLPEAIGKEEQITKIIRILSRKNKKNVLVIGEPGSGKTTLVGGIAKEIYKGTKYSSLRFKRLVALDVGSLTAGASNFGVLNERLKNIISEIKGARNIILFADEVHNLATALSDDPQASTIFSVFEPHLDKADFQFVGATNVTNYKKYIESHGAFARLFEVVNLPEATEDITMEILKENALLLEKKHGLIFTYPSLKSTIDLSKRLVYDRVFPDKAVDVVEDAATLALNDKKPLVEKADIVKIVSEKTSVPIAQIGKQESSKLLNLEEEFHKRIVDQEEAVKAVSSALRRARVGVREEKRPIASFLFVGPTGVGKTETSKALSEIYFGGESTMIRMDMSEYQTKDSVGKMIGPPPGQPGALEGGQLTERVRRNPFSLVLLDELEKAHTDIILLFLQVMDDGRLTDSLGKTVDFTNTIIIATSNVGTKKLQEVSKRGADFAELKDVALSELQNRFPPEFLNRFSGIVTFKPLSPEDVEKITILQMKGLTKRLLGQGIKIEYSKKFIAELARQGYDPQWGARPLRRLIQDKIEARLAKEILAGSIEKGDTKKLDDSYLKD